MGGGAEREEVRGGQREGEREGQREGEKWREEERRGKTTSAQPEKSDGDPLKLRLVGSACSCWKPKRS